jgi:hypothetical protein
MHVQGTATYICTQVAAHVLSAAWRHRNGAAVTPLAQLRAQLVVHKSGLEVETAAWGECNARELQPASSDVACRQIA